MHALRSVRHGLAVMVLSLCGPDLCDPKGVAPREKIVARSKPCMRETAEKEKKLLVDSFYNARCKRIAHVHDPMQCLCYFIIHSFNYLKKKLSQKPP
jgi:hypothetical protein